MRSEALPSRRGRRILIALVIVLLILLPLYLWPLRGGLGGPQGATVLPGVRPDPRSAAALAQIPADVWDALMGRSAARPLGALAPGPRNLTMIAQRADSLLDSSVGESPLSESPAALARALIAQLGEPAHPPEGAGEDDGSVTTPGQFPARPLGDGLAPGGYPNPSSPWHGAGPGGGPGFTLIPGDPGALEPTPEPATLLLVGSNLALLGAAAWRRRCRRRERPSRG